MPLVTAPVPPPAPMPAVATQAGARLFFGAGVVAVPALLAVEVHCSNRIEMPDRAVRPAPLPWTPILVTQRGREAPGFRNRKSIGVFPEPDVV